MTVLHKNLTGTDLHEPKGVATATVNQVYTANGAGSGAWSAQIMNIVDLSSLTAPAVDDSLPIYDLSATSNKKITPLDLLETFSLFTALTVPAVDDSLLIYDLDVTTGKSITTERLLSSVSVLTTLTAPAIDDTLLIYDLSTTTAKAITTVDLLETVNVLTEDTSPDTAADFALVYDTSASTVKKVKPVNLQTTQDLTSASTSIPIGYETGAGGVVTQLTSKSTGVTLNTLSGTITTHNANLASGSNVGFIVTNSLVAATDVVILSISGTGNFNAYALTVYNVTAGSFGINIMNNFVAGHTDAIPINFAVIKGATS